MSSQHTGLAAGHHVASGQAYLPWRPGGRAVRICRGHIPGQPRALVVDALTGVRPRFKNVRDPHPTGLTPAGRARRAGYRLATTA